MGFTRVYRYTAGKRDWFAHGLPMAGERAAEPKAGDEDVLRRDVPTCRPDERVGVVRDRVLAGGWNICLVTNETGIVLGRLHSAAWESDAETAVEQVMENGPTSFRPDYSLETLLGRMQAKNVGSVVVTNSDGVLMGVLFRKDVEQRLTQVRLEEVNE